jgi:hypothetical protein|tara:strand:- start:306 stop:572 length:267 start_codon:yes stop_codon:yes gene_type:complete
MTNDKNNGITEQMRESFKRSMATLDSMDMSIEALDKRNKELSFLIDLGGLKSLIRDVMWDIKYNDLSIRDAGDKLDEHCKEFENKYKP